MMENRGMNEEPENSREEQADDQNTAEEKENLEEQNSGFSFLTETVKPKRVSRRTFLSTLGRIAVYGVIFGIFACFSFFALRPWASNLFQQEPEDVTIEEDEEIDEEIEDEEPEEPEVPAGQVLTGDSYEQMVRNLYSIAQTVERSVVMVQAESDQEWIREGTLEEKGSTGLVLADNGRDLLILTEESISEDAEDFTVVFSDGSRYEATLQQKDMNHGLAVFGVSRDEISSSTWGSIHVADLGNSNLVKQGDVVIALGSMFGYNDGFAYGIISSKGSTEDFADGQMGVLSTDIPMTEDGSGILFNLDGEVVGYIRNNGWESVDTNVANAFAISDLKSVIELMANGKDVPYFGVHVTGIPKEVTEKQGIPEGIYVAKVEPDSPAMEAGIQSGDVIQKINGKSVTGLASYEKAVLDCRFGTEIKVEGKRRSSGTYADIDFTITLEEP